MSKLKTTTENLEILNLSIAEISKKLDKKEISSVELTKEVFEYIKKIEPKIKAFITLTEEKALGQAAESDKLYAKNHKRRSQIDGIPISIKDLFCTKNIKTTAGAKMLENFVPPYDATVVKRLKDAGAIIIGKNNCDAWAHGSSGENSDFQLTKNPWELSHVPGGSSSGSAAAVAANMGFASFGTDTGGSIRQPASLCGITGLKPTYGRVSRYGVIAMASSLDCPGLFTRNAQDAAILLEIIGGHDKLDSTTVPNKKFSSSLNSYSLPLTSLKIGLPKEYFAKGLDKKIKERIDDALEIFKKLGAKIIDISLPNTDYGLAVYYIIQPAEVSSNLARYDGVKYGLSAKNHENILDLYLKTREQGFGDEAKRRIMIGTYVLSSGYYDAYYKKAMQVRTLVKQDFDQAFKNVDLIITPTSPTTAFKFGEKNKDPLKMYLSDIYTVSANIAGIPGVSIPCGFIDGLPVGMQIMGPQFSEEKMLYLASIYQQNTVWHKQIPNL
jgi:aspartyl-tRNA(Asn)/glutamyl-tRNA(Gln) amidotransferase subunit A